MTKRFILDTNILIHDPDCLTKFQENEIILIPAVLSELDKFKSESTQRGSSARHIHQLLRKYFNGHNPLEGAILPNKGRIRLAVCPNQTKVFDIYPEHSADHSLLHATMALSADEKNMETILVTKDINLFLKAKTLGLKTEDYRNDRIETPPQAQTNEGLTIIEPESPADIRSFEKHGFIQLEDEKESLGLNINEWAMIRHNEEDLGLVRHVGNGRFNAVRIPKELIMATGRSIQPKNLEQIMLIDALLDPKISLVTVSSKAGTGKTFIAAACGLYQTLPNPGSDRAPIFQKTIISRPIIGMGPELGFLPGSMVEKMNPWLAGYHDNIDQILRPCRRDDSTRKEIKRQKKIGNEFRKPQTPDIPTGGPAKRPGDVLIEQGLIEIQPLAFIRGRSLIKCFAIFDEVQNTTPHEVKTFITRLGEGAKMVLIGDPTQIDANFVDARSNGLAYVHEKMKGLPEYAHVKLVKGMRSRIAELAADRM